MTVVTGKPEWAQTKRDKAREASFASGQPARRRRRWPWVLAAVVLAVGVGVFVVTRPSAPAVESASEPPSQVMQLIASEVTVVTPQLLQRTVTATGSLKPQRQADLSAQVAGMIKQVNVRPGDDVAQGDVLIEIDAQATRNQLAQISSTAEATRAQLALAKSQLDRSRSLADKGLSTPSELEQAQANVDAQQANLAALEAQVTNAEESLANATVVAPFDGVVAARLVEPGQSIAAGTQLMSVVNLDTMEAAVSVGVSSSALVEAGQEAVMTAEGFEDQTFSGLVDRINPVAIEGTRAVPVYALFDNASHLLRGGMFVSGKIVVAERPDAIALPIAAIREDSAGTYVLTVEGGKVARRDVVVGETWDDGRLVEIAEGIAAGDTVVSLLLSELEPGQDIELVEG